MSSDRATPTYTLADLQQLVRLRHYDITLRAEQDAANLGISRAEIATVVLALTPSDFHKSMEAEKAPGAGKMCIARCGGTIRADPSSSM